MGELGAIIGDALETGSVRYISGGTRRCAEKCAWGGNRKISWGGTGRCAWGFTGIQTLKK